jgi:hypothetical protein
VDGGSKLVDRKWFPNAGKDPARPEKATLGLDDTSPWRFNISPHFFASAEMISRLAEADLSGKQDKSQQAAQCWIRLITGAPPWLGPFPSPKRHGFNHEWTRTNTNGKRLPFCDN